MCEVCRQISTPHYGTWPQNTSTDQLVPVSYRVSSQPIMAPSSCSLRYLLGILSAHSCEWDAMRSVIKTFYLNKGAFHQTPASALTCLETRFKTHLWVISLVPVDGWMDGSMKRRKEGQMDRKTDRQTQTYTHTHTHITELISFLIASGQWVHGHIHYHHFHLTLQPSAADLHKDSFQTFCCSEMSYD